MTHDTTIAFSSLDTRADSMSPSDPLDRISLRDHIVEIEIGAFQVERDVSQRLKFNVVVEVYPVAGDIADDVDKILSYDTIAESIATELAAERLNLLETLAERIGDRILAEPQAARVFVRIEKLDRGPGDLGVEIVRGKGQEQTNIPRATSEVQVVFLPWEVANGNTVNERIDVWANGNIPTVVCVRADPNTTNKVNGVHGRRIDLLAIEQAAWTLSARDARCAVVNTRTELDWSIKNGQLAIWAPSKMVMDAVDGPTCDTSDGLGLARWFANEISAGEVVVIEQRGTPNV